MSGFDIEESAVVIAARVASKQQAIELAAEQAAHCYGLESETVLSRLVTREAEGSTGFGRGVAIPHGKVAGLPRPALVLLRLDRAVDFDAIDNEPVDIVMALLSPEGSGAAHLRALAHLSRLTRDERVLANIRGATHRGAVYALLSHELDRDAA